jgi:hypothetical protein
MTESAPDFASMVLASPKVLAAIDYAAYVLAEELSAREVAFDDPRVGDVARAAVDGLETVDPVAASIIAGALQARVARYSVDAPWIGWPLDHHAQRLATLLADVAEEEEEGAIIEEFCSAIAADMIRAGYSSDTADDWTCEIAGHSAIIEMDIRAAGGVQAGRA